MAKRAFDLFFALTGLLVLSPLLLLLAVAVKVSSRGPVLFRQRRVGKDCKSFYILKFRSMVADSEELGLPVTRDGDPRITTIGRFLRKTKLDELPQLWNVFVGEMSFVGPRPEVPRYVEQYTADQARVLALKPGVTDVATLEFRNEEELLGTIVDVERFYREYCVPRKIQLNLAYAETANVWKDIKIILRTLSLLATEGRARNAVNARTQDCQTTERLDKEPVTRAW